MGIGFYYISVMDVSGKGRTPKRYYDGYFEDENLKPGEIIYEIGTKNESATDIVYDEVNSTDEIAYYYIESESSDYAKKEITQVEIEGIKVEEAKKTFKKQKEIERGPIISHVSIEIENVIQMPSLTWKIKEDDIIEEVYVSVIAARAFDHSGSGSSKFEIVLKDGTEWHYNSRTGNIYRYDYIDIDSISGISLNGTFYSVSGAERIG